MNITIGVLNFPSLVEDVEWVKQRASEQGIDVEIIPVELSAVYDVNTLLTFDVFYTGEAFENNLFSSLLVLFYGKNSIIGNFVDAEWKAMLDSEFGNIMKEHSREESVLMAYMEKIEKQLIENKIIIFTYHTIEKQTFRSYLKGIEISGLGWPNFQKIWFEKKSKDAVYWKE